MAEREADDRAHPERLCQQAVVLLVSDADREISPEFRRRLRARDSVPSLFDASELAGSARTALEIEIARNIQAHQGVDSTSLPMNGGSEAHIRRSSSGGQISLVSDPK
jgi:hypothetical protein